MSTNGEPEKLKNIPLIFPGVITQRESEQPNDVPESFLKAIIFRGLYLKMKRQRNYFNSNLFQSILFKIYKLGEFKG